MSKRRKKDSEIVVRVKVNANPEDLRLAVVRLRALSDRLLEMAERGEAVA